LLVDPRYGKVFNFVKSTEQHLQQVLGQGRWTGLNSDQGTNRVIVFLDWNTQNVPDNYEEKKTVKHEIAHNFDSSNEKAIVLNRVFPDLGLGILQVLSFFHWQWIGQSGWEPKGSFQISDGNEIASRSGWDSLFSRPASQMASSTDGNWSYLASLPDSNFARSYGKYNPYEDWTTTVELYDDIVNGSLGSTWRTTYARMTNKLELIDLFFTTLRGSGYSGNGNIFSLTTLTAYYNAAFTAQTGYVGLSKP
jgi:hypothetical protein